MPTAPTATQVTLPERWRSRLEITPRFESPSSIVSFMGCQLRWFVERHAGVELGADFKVATSAGTFVHRVLEIFYNELPEARTDEMLWAIFDDAWNALVNHDASEGIVDESLVSEFSYLEEDERSAEAMRQRFYDHARLCVSNMLDFIPDPTAVKVAGNEVWVKADVRSVTVRGKVDLVETTPRGTERIVDWKSGRAPDANEVDVLDPTFVPVGLYALMRERSRDQHSALAPEVGSVRLVYLKELRSFTAKITPEVLTRVEEHVDAVVEQMEEITASGTLTMSPATSSRSGACKWCPLVAQCPAWSENTVADMARDLPVKIKKPRR